jgi:diguanylate cyclase
VVAPETTLDGAAGLAERIRSTVEKTRVIYKDQVIEVTVSIGFAVAEPEADTDFEQMKHTASAALSDAKAAGRNRCIVRSVR